MRAPGIGDSRYMRGKRPVLKGLPVTGATVPLGMLEMELLEGGVVRERKRKCGSELAGLQLESSRL